MTQPLGHPKDEPSKTVPVAIYLKDGHMVESDEGGVRYEVGTATVTGAKVSMTLADQIPDAVMDVLVGSNEGAKFSLAFATPQDISFPVPPQGPWYVEGCTCVWNNGLNRVHGHHKDCPTLKGFHHPYDRCGYQGHSD